MKKVVRNILVVAVMLGTCASYANEITNILPTSYKEKNDNYIKVTDASGKVIFSGQTKHFKNIEELFDFAQLKDGTYTLEITKAFEIDVNSFKVKDHSVTFIDNAKKKIFKPVLRTENAQVIISKLALDSDDMTIELYFEEELFHTETLKGEQVLNRVYQLDDRLPGDYTAIIKSNGRVYVENFRI